MREVIRSGRSKEYQPYESEQQPPLSGLYEGRLTSDPIYWSVLSLRVDIDSINAYSPVTNHISGDFWHINIDHWSQPGKLLEYGEYEESWISDYPKVSWGKKFVIIKGDVRFWKGSHVPTEVEIVIPRKSLEIATAQVSLIEKGGNKRTYDCKKVSNFFRDLTLEVDICKSVNENPIQPCYDTHCHPIRPPGLAQRTLTLESTYNEAGVNLTFRSDESSIIDDSAPEFDSWSEAELHDVMEQYFSQSSPYNWPSWNLWGVLASKFDEESVLGIMFDSKAPERQGFAIFRKHWMFDRLVAAEPANDEQAAAMREFLFCWVHEAGHAFNLMHAFDKGRPLSLSWMNYPQIYDGLTGKENNFWSNFMMRFDDSELIHLRHGDLLSVIMGGDPFTSGGHLEVAPGAMSPTAGEVPVELLIRSKEYFALMEPVTIEIRLRNLTDLSIPIDANLMPEYGTTKIYVKRPDGTVIRLKPPLCLLAKPAIKILKPSDVGISGEDRLSDRIFLSYNADGFLFDKPGQYSIRAVYQGLGNLLISSNIHRIRIGIPASSEDDVVAHQFFTHPVGMSLYLHGSRSPFLTPGMTLLEKMAENRQDTLLGTSIADRIFLNIGRDFFRVQNRVLTLTHPGDPEKALKLTEPAIKLYRSLKGDEAKALNISYNKLVQRRARFLMKTGKKAKAKKELSELQRDLAERGVHESVLNNIKESGERL